MGGIQVVFLRRDFTTIKKKIRSNVSHIHHDKGSYLNRGDAILKTADENDSPMLIFQEGNAIPMSANSVKVPENANNPANNPQLAQHPLEAVKWETWYIPMLRGLNRRRPPGTSFEFRKLFNLSTLPFWIIGLALLWQFLSPIFIPAAPAPVPDPILPPLP